MVASGEAPAGRRGVCKIAANIIAPERVRGFEKGEPFSLPFSRNVLARTQSFAWKTLISRISSNPIPTVCCRPSLGPETVRIAYNTPL